MKRRIPYYPWERDLRDVPSVSKPICSICGASVWFKKRAAIPEIVVCPACEADRINSVETASLSNGDVLACCPNCRIRVEVQTGYVTPAHPTPRGTKLCIGSGRAPIRFEKVQHETAAKAAWRANRAVEED